MPAPRHHLTLGRLEARDVPTVIGGLDTGFNRAGTPGTLALTAVAGDTVNAVAPLGDGSGRMVAVGKATTGAVGGSDFLMMRLLPDGTLDKSFGASGRLLLDFNGAADEALGVGESGGRVVVVGSGGGPTSFFCVASMDLTGVPTATFLPPATTTPGRGRFNAGGTDIARSVGFQSAANGGNIVVAGSTTNALGGPHDFAVLRLNPTTGAVVQTAGADFKRVNFSSASDDQAFALAMDTTGTGLDTVVVAGSVGTTGSTNFGVARLSADLTTVTLGTASPAGANVARAVAIQLDGNVVFAGTNGTATNPDFVVGRLKASTLALDTTFNPAGSSPGLKQVDVGGGSDTATGLALDRFGRITVSGFSQLAGSNAVGVVRLLGTTGALDPSFNPAGGIPGVARFTAADAPASATALVVQGAGRIMVAGASAAGKPTLTAVVGGLGLPSVLGVGGDVTGRAVALVGQDDGTLSNTPVDLGQPFPGFTGPVRVAGGDVNGDGVPDAVVVMGPGTTATKFAVLDGNDPAVVLVPPTDIFGGDPPFTAGAFAAAADLDGDGKAELVFTPDVLGSGRTVIYSLAGTTLTLRASFLGIDDAGFRGGARVALGDIDGDGIPEVVVAAGFGGGPRVAVFAGKTILAGAVGTAPPKLLANDFFAFPGADETSLRNGAYVTVADLTGDGKAELVFGAGNQGSPRVIALDGAKLAAGDLAGARSTPVADFRVNGDDAARSGVRLTARDLDGDGKAELVTASGDGKPARLRVYKGTSFPAGTAEPAGGTDLTVLGGGNLLNGVFVG